jgi:glycerophosphoryl diester phosphodiesterase
VGIVVLVALALSAPAQAAAPEVQAHRGGSLSNGVPLYPENTLPAFEAAAAGGYTIELDVSRALDGMIVIHDPTLERTTVCSGQVRMRTLALLRNCPSDVLGSPGSSLGGVQVPGLRVPLPRVEEVLALAKRTGARLSIETKNVPTESDFDVTMRVAFGLAKAIKASGLPPSQLVVQSFWPPNLDVIELLLPRVPTALLTLSALNDAAPLYAKARGYEWVSPQWPVKASTVSLAHKLGVRVVPFTLNRAADVQAAAAAGVDAVITDDPPMATAALGG